MNLYSVVSAPALALPIYYDRLRDAIAAGTIDVRPGRLELTREWKHYPHLRLSRCEWQKQRLKEVK
jgi:hypothetical protein